MLFYLAMFQILFDFYARRSEVHVFSRKFFFVKKKIMDVNGNSTLSVEELKKWLIGRVGDDDDVIMGKKFALEK